MASVKLPAVAAVAPHAVVAWKPRAWRPSALTPQAQGLRVAIDPIDGTLSMPVEDPLMSQLEVEGERVPVATQRRANGSIRATLDDRFAEFAMARIGADGKPMWTCVSGPKGAAQFLKSAATPAAPVTTAPAVIWEVQ